MIAKASIAKTYACDYKAGQRSPRHPRPAKLSRWSAGGSNVTPCRQVANSET
jgi:hypothetical protein